MGDKEEWVVDKSYEVRERRVVRKKRVENIFKISPIITHHTHPPTQI